jgi:hypothetical protein
MQLHVSEQSKTCHWLLPWNITLYCELSELSECYIILQSASKLNVSWAESGLAEPITIRMTNATALAYEKSRVMNKAKG